MLQNSTKLLYSSGPENVTEILIKVRGRWKDQVFGGTSTLFECVTECNVWAIEWRVVKMRQNHHPGLNASKRLLLLLLLKAI